MRNKSPLALVLALLVAAGPLSVAAHADNDRMPGRMDRRNPQNETAPAPKPAHKPAGKVAAQKTQPAADESGLSRRERRALRRATRDIDSPYPETAPPPRPPRTATKPQSENQDRNDSASFLPARENERASTARDETERMPVARPPVKNIPIARLEHYGLLTTPAQKSLGIDMWIGSSRAAITELLPKIPAESRYRVLHELTERMLLTETDPAMIGGGRAADGQDLMTLRLEKLLDIGAYDDAARLYAVNPGRPYHERLARAGVTAMLYSARRPLGCLEIKALASGYKSDPFWPKMTAVCDLYLSADLAGHKQVTLPRNVFDDSALLQKIVEKPDYKYRPDKMDDLAGLDATEKLAVFTLARVDYSRLARLSLADVMKTDPTLLTALLADESLPPRLRLFTMLAAVARGTADAEQLTALYKLPAFGGELKTERNWKAMPALYQQAAALPAGNERDSMLQQALELRKTFGTAALLPFAPLLAESDPGNLPPESITGALAVMVKAGQEIPRKWRNLGLAALSPQHQSADDILIFFAYDISENFAPFKSLEPSEFEGFFTKLPPASAKIVKTIYEKLDKNKELHNIAIDRVYENDPVLTAPDDYVMPLGSLLNSLALAESDKRLGEVILISSILLRSTPAGKITPEVLGKVLDGYKTVGLTKEARELAAEVVLGLRK